ncbi:MAG: PAS domain S-box protein [Pararhodobacter sp.]|nr:PAS domain S-box protein [Pararhodobacter sp.]
MSEDMLLSRLGAAGKAVTRQALRRAAGQLVAAGLAEQISPGEWRRAAPGPAAGDDEHDLAELLASLASNLLQTRSGEMAGRIDEALERVSRFVGADRGFVFHYDWDRGLALYAHEWCADGISAQIDAFAEIDFDAIAAWMELHSRSESVVIDDVKSYGDDSMRAVLQAQNIQSTAAVPMMRDGRCVGCVGFDSVRAKRPYSEHELRLLRVLAQILVNARLLDEDRRALEAERRKLEIIVEGTAAGTWIWWIDSGRVEINALWAEMLGYRREELEPVDISIWERLSHPDDLARAQALIARNVSGELPYYEAVVRMRHKAGHWVWVLTRGRVMLHDELGKGRILAGIHQDITESEAARRQLQELSDIVNRSPVVATRWQNSEGWPVQYVSDNIALFGYSPKELLSGKIVYTDLIHPDDLPRIAKDVARHLASGPDEYRQEYRLRHGDGRWIWIDDSTWLTRDASGEVTRINGVLFDNSDRKLAEHKLASSQAELLEAQRLAKLGHWELDLATGALEGRGQTDSIIGVNGDDFPNTPEAYLELVHPEDREFIMSVFRDALGGTIPSGRIEHRLVTPRGAEKWVQLHSEVIHDSDGHPSRITGTIQDVTETKQLEADREALAGILEYSTDLAALKSPDQIYLAVNYAFLASIGRSREEVIGKTDWEVFDGIADEEQIARYVADTEKALALPKGERIEIEERATRADGSQRIFLSREFPVYRADGRVLIGAATLSTDITERKRAETSLAESEARFRTLFDEAPVSIMVHDQDTGAVLDANKAALDTHGVGNVAQLQTGDLFNAPGYGPEKGRALIRKAAAEGAHSFEWFTHRPDGQDIWESVHLRPFVLDGAARVMSTSIDITEIKQVQAALAESEERFRTIFDEAAVSIIVRDKDTAEVVDANMAACRGYGLNSVDELKTGEIWGEPPYSFEDARALVRKAAIEGTQNFEWQGKKADGSRVWKRVTLTPVRIGGVLRVVATSMDITKRVQAEQALAESERRFRGLLEDIPNIAVQGYAPDFKVFFWNKGSEQLYGYTRDEALGQSVLELTIPAEMRAEFENEIAAWLEKGEKPPEGEMTLLGKDGAPVEVFSSQARQINAQGQTELYCIDIDITERKQFQRRLELLAGVFSHSHDGIIITDADACIIEVNNTFCAITGYDREEVIGRNPAFLSSGRQSEKFYRDMWKKLNQRGFWSGALWNARKSGEHYAERLTISAIRDEHGHVSNYVGIFSDITMQMTYHERLERTAHYDELTGLPNRALLTRRLEKSIQSYRLHELPLALAYIDLDGFKAINDMHGHAVGDRYLVAVAERLRSILREDDLAARIGGDEFVLLVHNLSEASRDHPFFNRLKEAMQRPLTVNGFDLPIAASIGVSFYPQPDVGDGDQLIRQADQAMYAAKKSGKNRMVFFDAQLESEHRAHVEALARFRGAIEAGEMVLHYQPKVDLQRGRVMGVEALLRWDHPQDGLLAPHRFLNLINSDAGLALEVVQWVIAHALADLESLRRTAPDLGVSINFNVAAQPDSHARFIAKLIAALDSHPSIPPDRVTLEILESTLIEDVESAAAAIGDLHALGVRISLDDFGTGYSSLTYLKNLPLDELKIDRSFVRDMLQDSDDLSIVHGIIALARALSIPVVAEGVEQPEHALMLMRMGCTQAQGYAIARPMPLSQLHEWLANWRPDPAWQDVKQLPESWLALLGGLSAHRNWQENLRQYMDGATLRPPELSPKQCNFGHLIHALAQADIPEAEFEALDAAHHKVHEHATLLHQARQAGDKEAARQQYDLAASAGEKLTGRLLAFLAAGVTSDNETDKQG